MKFKAPNLITQIIIGIIVGIVAGHFWPVYSQKFKLLSDIFLHLIKMIIAPLVLATLIVGIGKVGDFKSVGRIGVKTLVYFQFATGLALVLGLILVNLLEPGKVMNLSIPAEAAQAVVKPKEINIREFVLNVFPTSIVDAMAKNQILQIIVFSLFFGIAASALGATGEPVLKLMDSLSHIMFKITNYIMKFAPFAIFGALAAVVGKEGLGIFQGYAYLIASFFGGLIFFIFGILGLLCFALRIPFFKLLAIIKEPFLLAFSTASSEAALPKTVESLERYGCSNRVISFVLPLGYSFNLDGSVMYMTFATVFIAQAYGIDLTIQQQLTMLLMLLVTSKGMAGVPRASLVVIAGMLEAFNIPSQGLLLILGVDWLLDMGRSATNVVGNAVATAVICKWEKELHPVKPVPSSKAKSEDELIDQIKLN